MPEVESEEVHQAMLDLMMAIGKFVEREMKENRTDDSKLGVINIQSVTMKVCAELLSSTNTLVYKSYMETRGK